MPCYEVQTVSVEFKVAHRDLLEKAAKTLGWEFSYSSERCVLRPNSSASSLTLDFATGKALISTTDQGRLNELKRAYSREAIKQAAKLGGWQVKLGTNNKGQLLRGCL